MTTLALRPGRVAVQHEDDMAESLQKSLTLGCVEGRSHEPDEGPDAGLMHFHAIEESLYHHDGVLHSGGDAMQVEKDLRLGEARGEPVPRLSLVYRASAISH